MHSGRPFTVAVATTTTTLMPLRLASPDFATQTGGAKGALAPTISVRPPVALPPPLCRSFHSCGCPHCAPQFTHPAPPILPCPLSSPACWGVQEGQRAPSPLCPGYAAHKGKGRVQGEGLHARQGGGQTSKWGCARTEGDAHPRTLSTPSAPSRST